MKGFTITVQKAFNILYYYRFAGTALFPAILKRKSPVLFGKGII
jgi:hypothetical protein